MELKGKLGQSSVNGLLNNSSSVNTLPLPYFMEVDSLRGKMFQCNNQSRQSLSWLCTISIQCLNMDYPQLKLELQYLFNASTHSREAWKHGTRHKGTFQLCQSLVNVLYFIILLIVLFYNYYADICKISNFRNFSRKLYFEFKHFENGLADFSDTYIIL